MIKILNFSAAWCGPCRQMEPTIKMMQEKYPGLIKKISIEENPELAVKHGVRSIPQLVVIQMDGDREEKELERLQGGQTRSRLLEFFNKYSDYGKQ